MWDSLKPGCDEGFSGGIMAVDSCLDGVEDEEESRLLMAWCEEIDGVALCCGVWRNTLVSVARRGGFL